MVLLSILGEEADEFAPVERWVNERAEEYALFVGSVYRKSTRNQEDFEFIGGTELVLIYVECP